MEGVSQIDSTTVQKLQADVMCDDRAIYSIAFFLGGFTILLSLVVYFTLGTSNELQWLSPDEKATIKDRLEAEKLVGQDRHRNWDKEEATRALRDPQTHFFWLATMLSAMPSTVITTFGRMSSLRPSMRT